MIILDMIPKSTFLFEDVNEKFHKTRRTYNPSQTTRGHEGGQTKVKLRLSQRQKATDHITDDINIQVSILERNEPGGEASKTPPVPPPLLPQLLFVAFSLCPKYSRIPHSKH